MLFSPSPQPRNPLKRPAKMAELRGGPIGNINHTLIQNLMEPVVVTITATEMVLFGFEWHHVDHHLHEFAQGWLVHQVRPGEKRMRRGDVPM